MKRLNPELKDKALSLCYEIEKLPASEQQTKISIMASEIHSALSERQSVVGVEELALMEEIITYSACVRNDIITEDDGVTFSSQCKEWVDGLIERIDALKQLRGK